MAVVACGIDAVHFRMRRRLVLTVQMYSRSTYRRFYAEIAETH